MNSGTCKSFISLSSLCAENYNPVTGRWLAKDPIGFNGGDVNLYRYANNDPINVTDPSGKIVVTGSVVIAGGAIAGGVVGAIAGYATSNSCSLGGKLGDALIGGVVGAAGGVLAAVGSIGAIVSGTTLGFTGTLGVTLGGIAAGAGPSALGLYGPSSGGGSCGCK